MSIVHVTPQRDLRPHADTLGADCWCEPSIEDVGLDEVGQPARVIVHHAADGRDRHEGQN